MFKIRHQVSTPRVSARCRRGVAGVDNRGQIRIISSYMRHKCTKLMKKPTPATPCRPPADGGGGGFFSLNKGLIPTVIGDNHELFVHADT